ncbi:MAG: DUF2157 domain-containing protein [Candidatus Aureabacteria bacterium]|nr:DUF2157 domain-containing protein [Candidatus Auribacterota bacterium]
MSSPRRQLIDLIEQGTIPAEKIEAALAAVKVTPDGKSWRTFIDQFLIWLGGLALAFAVMFFIAYNWKSLGHFTKFAMVEGFMALAIAAYCKLADNTIAGKVWLLVAAISLGVLLALYGQTYQTGADPWQLFFNWALLMLPWALISRFPAIWIVWVALVNVSIIMYYLTFGGIFGFVIGSESGMLWGTFLFNTFAFIAWQLLVKAWHWLSQNWAVRLLAVGSGVPLTWLVLFSIFNHREADFLPGLVWGIWLGAMYCVYRKLKVDLFMLAGCCLSAITVIISFLGKHLLHHGDSGVFLFLALVVIAMGGGSALWLKKVSQESLS